jgi:hypothetical protein
MKTATFKQQDYKFHVARKLEQFNNFPKMDGYQNTEKLKTSQQVFSDNKRKSLYIFICIYTQNGSIKKRVSAFIFLASFSYWSIQQIQQLIPNSFSQSHPPLTIHTIPLAGTTGSM